MRRSASVRWGMTGVIIPAMLSLVTASPLWAQQTSVVVNQAATAELASATQPNGSSLPDSPGAVAARNAQQSNLTPTSAAPQSANAGSQQQAQTPPPRKPVGTATAEAPTTTGVAASQPAGVAIAPAKQHRVRTIVLRTGAVIAAGVAVGTVVALSAATPSKPPGAH